MSYFSDRAKRKDQRKQIEHAMFQLKYARRMREDQISEAKTEELRTIYKDLKSHLKSGELGQGVKLAEKGIQLAHKVHPAHKGRVALRENVEVFVVVMAVALGIRTYFLQPYQIPTGSMQPTLYGITSHVEVDPTWADRMPFKLGKFLITGAWYTEKTAKADGVIPPPQLWGETESHMIIPIGGQRHKIRKDLMFADYKRGILYAGVPLPGTPILKGDVLAKGIIKRGDSIVVNRLTTNFVPPKRGDIVVFHTGGLPAVRKNSAYIKRLTGMPGEAMAIRDGKLYADGKLVDSPEVFRRQIEHENYPGYSNPTYREYEKNGDLPPIFADPNQSYPLAEDEYLMMGDNTNNSLDGRYFGGVPEENIMGIGFFVPWPFIQRGIYGEHAGLVR
jgi:signal peptidase I